MKKDVHQDAAWVIDRVNGRQAGLKTAVFRDLPSDLKERAMSVSASHLRRVYALAVETLRFASTLEELLSTQKPLKELLKDSSSRSLLLVLAHDALVSEKSIPGVTISSILKSRLPQLKCLLDDRVKSMLNPDKSTQSEKFRSLLPDWSMQQETARANLPRYVRVNHIRASVQDVITEFQQDGWQLEMSCSVPSAGYFFVDPLISDLLVFPPGTDFHSHSAVLAGRVVLQDKASCMPVAALFNDGWLPTNKAAEVIDCCAAPGNKTSQLASMLASSGVRHPITAFERDPSRATLLKNRLQQCGASRGSSNSGTVMVKNEDFLLTDPIKDARWRNVRAVIVDPSCSGSGLGHRLDHARDSAVADHSFIADEQNRIESLARFQSRILRHALKFPRIERVVYSTCSTHEAENEEVVASVLPFAEKRGLSLLHCLPNWTGRGQKTKSLPLDTAQLCVRCGGGSSPQEVTHGFFVALFGKKKMKGEPCRTENTTVSRRQKPTTSKAVASKIHSKNTKSSWKLAKPTKKRSRK